MSIEVEDILDRKARKYGTAADSEQFMAIIIDAINFTLDDLENGVGIATSRVTDITDTISLDAQKYGAALSIGVDYYTQDNSAYTIQSLPTIKALYDRKISQARVTYLQDQTIYGPLGDLS